MESDVQLVADGDGLAVIGEKAAVDSFLMSEGLSSLDLGLPRLSSVLNVGGSAAQAGSEIMAGSGRWVKLTEESARTIKKYGLRESAKTGCKTGVVKGKAGQARGFVEFAKGPGSLLTNPAMLAGVAGIMAQAAMKQSMDEIADYLRVIDEKVDDVLRAQKDQVLAEMIGVGFVIEEAMTLRESRGRVDEVTWSKVQHAPQTIAATQAYALRQLDAIAEKMERKTKIGDLAKTAKEAETQAQEWLVVLARCFQLQDAIGVLELDRVLDASPDELDGHRLGLRAARQDRLDRISRTTDHVLARMTAAAGMANTKVLLHPAAAPGVVQSTKRVAMAVDGFQHTLGIERDPHALESRGWVEAATDARDKVLLTGSDGVDAAKRLSSESYRRAKSTTGDISGRIAKTARRGDGDDDVSAGD